MTFKLVTSDLAIWYKLNSYLVYGKLVDILKE